MIAILPMKLEDACRIRDIDRSEIINRVYRCEEGTLESTEAGHECPNWSEDDYREIISRFAYELTNGGTAFGAFDGERLVGFAVLAHQLRGKDKNQLQLDLMYVTREYRRQGIGRRLLEALSRVAIAQGATSLYISSTETESAVQFYTSCGSRLTQEVDKELFDKEPYDIHMVRPLRGDGMLQMRKATIADHPFLVRIDLKNDGYTVAEQAGMTMQQLEAHSDKIGLFVTDPSKGAFIVEDSPLQKPVAMIMYAIASRDAIYPWKTVFHEIDRTLFQSDGRFMEVFQLWVHPDYRRRGLATRLKRELEEEAKRREVNLIYTHTEEVNCHVIELNEKLGYREVRRGPIWDEVIRVSLIKQLSE